MWAIMKLFPWKSLKLTGDLEGLLQIRDGKSEDGSIGYIPVFENMQDAVNLVHGNEEYIYRITLKEKGE
jgi:hypothetical protein